MLYCPRSRCPALCGRGEGAFECLTLVLGNELLSVYMVSDNPHLMSLTFVIKLGPTSIFLNRKLDELEYDFVCHFFESKVSLQMLLLHHKRSGGRKQIEIICSFF